MLIFFVQKSSIGGIYNALISFWEVRIYLEKKERGEKTKTMAIKMLLFY